MSSHLADRIRKRREAERLSSVDYANKLLSDISSRPRGFSHHRRHERIGLAMFKHAETASALQLSVDGDESKAHWLPKSQLTICFEAGEFVCVIMKAWLAIDRNIAQASNPGLSQSRSWTAEQREAWASVKRWLFNLRPQLEDERREMRGQRKIYRGGGNAYGRNYFA
jgi:hypothetical protein